MFKAVKRTEGVSTTDIVGRMLTCGMEHFVDDEEIRGKRASDISADDAVSASEAVRCTLPPLCFRNTEYRFGARTFCPPATGSGNSAATGCRSSARARAKIC